MRRIIVTGHVCEIPSVGSRVAFTLECSPLNMGSAIHAPEHGAEPIDTLDVFVNGNAIRADLSIRGDIDSMEELGKAITKGIRIMRKEQRREAV